MFKPWPLEWQKNRVFANWELTNAAECDPCCRKRHLLIILAGTSADFQRGTTPENENTTNYKNFCFEKRTHFQTLSSTQSTRWSLLKDKFRCKTYKKPQVSCF